MILIHMLVYNGPLSRHSQTLVIWTSGENLWIMRQIFGSEGLFWGDAYYIVLLMK